MQYVMCHGKIIFRFFIELIFNTHRTIKRCHFRMQRAIVKVLFDIIFFIFYNSQLIVIIKFVVTIV